MSLKLRPLERRDAEACDAIVRTLPYHFGQQEGRRECAAAVRSSPGLVADEEGEVVAFLTWEPRFEYVVEITWLAVRADRRRGGLGRALIERLATEASVLGRPLLIALTVSPSDGPDEVADGYQGTRAFYAATGFELVRDLPGLWDADTPVLLVRPAPVSDPRS